jgi:DNA-binding helix-hairpin-helix protein with protein kinase domain
VSIGFKLADDAQLLWDAFQDLHNKHSLPGELEIPMESFARAVEIMLKSCWDADARNERPDPARWVAAVKACGYVQARMAVRKEIAPAHALEVA